MLTSTGGIDEDNILSPVFYWVALNIQQLLHVDMKRICVNTIERNIPQRKGSLTFGTECSLWNPLRMSNAVLATNPFNFSTDMHSSKEGQSLRPKSNLLSLLLIESIIFNDVI